MGYLKDLRDAAAAPAQKGGGGGLFSHLPHFGVGELFHELGTAPIGLARLAGSVLPGGTPAGEAFSRAGKGVLSSLIGTGATAATLIGVPGHNLGNAVEDFGERNLGEDYKPRDFFERSRDSGILPALFEDVGNVALGAGAAEQVMKVGAIGKAADAGAAVNRALRAGFEAADIDRAIEAGRSGAKLSETGIHDELLRRVAKTTAKASDTSGIAPKALERSTRNIERVHAVAHPYQSLAHDVLRPLTRASQARVLGPAEEAAAALSPEDASAALSDIAQTAPDARLNGTRDALARASSEIPADQTELLDRLRTTTKVDEAPLAEPLPDVAPPVDAQAFPAYEAAARRAATSPIPDWATSLVDRLPESVNNVLASGERKVAARQVGRVGAERTRMQDIARREILASQPVKDTKVAAKMLVDQELPDGTKITRHIADELIGDELKARLSQVADVEARAAEAGVDPALVRQTLVEAGQRTGTAIPTEWLRDAAGNPTPLSEALDTAAAAWRDAGPAHLDVMRASRQGEKGLESVGSRTPEMSKAEKTLQRSIEKDRQRVERLGPKADRERAAIQRKIGRTEARLAALRQEGAQAVTQASEASQRFTQTRLPAGKDVKDVLGGKYAVDTPTGLSPGLSKAVGLDAVKTPDGIFLSAQTPAQRAQSLPDIARETPYRTYRRGVEGGRAMEDIRAAADRAVDTQKRVAQLQKNLDDLRATLTNHTSPTDIMRERLSSRADRRASSLAKRLANPSAANVPKHFQPVYKAVTALAKAAETDARLAGVVGDITDRFGEVLRIADAHGFDPTYIGNLTDSEVRKLIYEQVQLGKPGRDLSQTIKSGARYASKGANDRTKSWDVLAASMAQATHEANTNALVDYIEQVVARPVQDLGGDAAGLPLKGWVPWDAERSLLLGAAEKTETGIKITGSPPPTMMIPKEVKSTLRMMQADFSHPAFNAIRKATNPWRLLVLTLSPRWYVNNVFGNVMLATKEGVSIRDWRNAITSYRRGGVAEGANRFRQKFGAGQDAFSDVPGAVEGGVFHEADTGARTLLEPKPGFKGVKQSVREADTITGKIEAATRPLRRGNEAIDELARVAVYHSAIRRGMSVEEALQRTYKAMVDYSDLSPFEREFVRAVVPFYAWQKGVLKIVGKVPLEHPAATGILMALGDLNKELAQDRYGGELPRYYEGLVNVPILGTLNTRAWNPFEDSGSLTTLQGIASSMNPFVAAATRNAFGAPEGGFVKHQRVNEFGTAVPDTSLVEDFGNIVQGLPQVRQTNTALNGGVRATALQGLGTRTYSPEDIQKLLDRLAKSQKKVQTGSR